MKQKYPYIFFIVVSKHGEGGHSICLPSPRQIYGEVTPPPSLDWRACIHLRDAYFDDDFHTVLCSWIILYYQAIFTSESLGNHLEAICSFVLHAQWYDHYTILKSLTTQFSLCKDTLYIHTHIYILYIHNRLIFLLISVFP